MSNWKIPKIWSGDCFVLGGGPSILEQLEVSEEDKAKIKSKELPPSALSKYFQAIHNQNIIGVNDSCFIGNWIDVAFFGDYRWFEWHHKKLVQFPGLLTTCCGRFSSEATILQYKLKVIKRGDEHWGLTGTPNKINWNSNSGAASINLAYHLGCSRIFLLGFDMDLSVERDATNWHGVHQDRKDKPLRGLPFNRHLKGFPKIKEDADKLGIEIINCNPNSRIDEFEKITYKEALRRIQ